jgi:putative FmdB family regulatory protein
LKTHQAASVFIMLFKTYQGNKMPIYEFKCDDCNQTFESLVLIASAIDSIRCKHCNSANIKKILSATSSQPAKGITVPAGALSGCSSRSGFS